jgi:hypothetical protein
MSEAGSEVSKMRRDHSARRSVASASANEGVRLAGYQGRVRQVGRAPWQVRYQSQIAEYVQKERAAARSGPRAFQHWGSSPPSNCLVLRKVSSIDQRP